jgi:hypothetical protein
MGPPGSPALLTFMVDQIDKKHDGGHGRLRKDLDEGLEKLKRDLALVKGAQQADHDALTEMAATKERRTELSANKTVIIAAAIGGGFEVLKVLITTVGHWVKP